MQYYIGKYCNISYIETQNMPYFEANMLEECIIKELKRKQEAIQQSKNNM